MYQQISQTLSYIKDKIGDFSPELGIVLGTGLAKLVDEIDIEKQLMYANIPNFPVSTVEFHSGKLIFGMLNGKRVASQSEPKMTSILKELIALWG